MPSRAPNGTLAFFLTLSACAFAATTIAKQISHESATITGSIVDDAGKATEGATVLVYSAHLKKGYAAVCPTCWIDCGKRAETDAEGGFTITDLNPALKFRLLVLKAGFAATAKGGVDPAQGILARIKLQPRATAPDVSKLVHGRVTDAAGNPVPGALIEPVAAFYPGLGYAIGTPPGIDAIAATDASGEFDIVATRPVEKVILKISPRALAAQLVTERPGAATNSVVLTEGATVLGRLVDVHGKPIAGAEVVMIPQTREIDQMFSDMRVGTDVDGSFAFTNVPAHKIWGIYPSNESLQDRHLAVGLRLLETIADRQIANVGSITLHSGYSVTGKVMLPDNQEIPPDTHVTINPDWTTYNRLADIAPDGTFEFTALAPDVYSLTVGISGYTPATGSPRKILVEGDRRGVILRMVRSP